MSGTLRGLVLGLLAALPLVAWAADAPAGDGATRAVVTAPQAGVYRKAGGKIASQVLSQGETVELLSSQPTDGCVSIKVEGSPNPGWVRMQDIEIVSAPQVLTAKPQ